MTENNGNPNPRAEYIAGLRMLADLLEAHPELEAPHTGASNYASISVVPWGADAQREQLAAWARVLPGRKDKKEGGEGGKYLRLEGRLGALHIQVLCDRDEVCERIVVGTETVTETVPDPEALAAVPQIERTVEREIVKWECRPLLAAESGAVAS